MRYNTFNAYEIPKSKQKTEEFSETLNCTNWK